MSKLIFPSARQYRPNAFAPHISSNLSRMNSPIPPFSPPQRSATLPLTPPSPESRAQDSAFPVFPTVKSRIASPTTPPDSGRPIGLDTHNVQAQSDTFGVFAPLSPKRLAGDDVMQRFKAISPGPFDTDKSRGHKKNPTSGSSLEDFIHSAGNSNVRKHSPHSSNASGSHGRDLSQSSTSSMARHQRPVHSSQSDFAGDLASTTSRSESAKPYTQEALPRPNAYAQSVPSLAQIGRSQTSPMENGGSGRYGSIRNIVQTQTSSRSPERPSMHRPTPSVAAARRPLDEIGSMSSFKPSRSLRMKREAAPAETPEPVPALKAEDIKGQKHQDVHPVSNPSLDFGIGNPYHFSTESASSNDSSGSDIRTASSRSSPPLNESPQRSRRKPDTSRLDNLMTGFQFDLDTAPVLEQPVPSRRSPLPSFSRPTYSRPTEPSRDLESSKESPVESVQPSVHSYHRPSDNAFAPSYPLQHGSLRGSPAPTSVGLPLPTQAAPSRPPPRAAPNKGSCRGCGELIFGKSVSSADGRLTGRYHKSCFVCTTCKEPFQTTDFYVISNHPYCARHYHYLNDSLCTTCDQGIEGQYLETEVKQKYHPYCFTCQVGLNALAIIPG